MRIFKITFGVCLVAFSCISAQNVNTPPKEISIRTIDFRQQGDSVYLTYSITPLMRIKKWAGYKVTCFIEKEDSVQIVDSLELMGKYSHIYAQRGRTSKTELHKWNKKVPTLEFTATFSYREWMRAESMHYTLSRLDCCSPASRLVAEVTSAAMKMEALPVPEPYAMQLHYTYLTPEAKAVKDMHSSGSAFLEFPSGKSGLLVDFKNNKYELSKIHTAIDSITKNKYARITGIELTGYASIDGNSTSNLNLSLSRAESVRGFIRSTYPQIPASAIRAQAGGEDWAGLKALISDMPVFEKINPVLEMRGTPDAREKKIRSMEGGRVYRTLSEEVFPRLRRVDYTVGFTVKGFTVEEGKELLKTAPGNLSLNELFLIANTYTTGSAEFQEVFDIAVRLYPQDTVARINAASVALERKDLQRASAYLNGLEKDPRSLNNRALLCLAQGKTSEAQVLLKEACASNDSSACQNENEILKYLAQEEVRSAIIRKNEGTHEKE